MPANDAIRRIREKHARARNYDAHVMFERMRAETEHLKPEGWKVVSPTGTFRRH